MKSYQRALEWQRGLGVLEDACGELAAAGSILNDRKVWKFALKVEKHLEKLRDQK